MLQSPIIRQYFGVLHSMIRKNQLKLPQTRRREDFLQGAPDRTREYGRISRPEGVKLQKIGRLRAVWPRQEQHVLFLTGTNRVRKIKHIFTLQNPMIRQHYGVLHSLIRKNQLKLPQTRRREDFLQGAPDRTREYGRISRPEGVKLQEIGRLRAVWPRQGQHYRRKTKAPYLIRTRRAEKKTTVL